MFRKKILKGAEISRQYKISRTTVTNWKKQAQDYANLELTVKNGKYQIIDSIQNHRELEKLARQAHITNGTIKHTEHVFVSKEFYDIFTKSEQIEIIDDLRRNKNINSKFVYKNKGAQLWNEDYYNLNKPTIKLLEQQKKFIEDVISQPINIVDLGCGNGEPAKWFLDNFQIKTYLGVDISQTLIDYCKSNISQDYPNVNQVYRQLDFEVGEYTQLYIDDDRITNKITLLLGDTICNYSLRYNILENVANSLNKDDLFIFDFSLDNVKEYSDFLGYIKPIRQKGDVLVAKSDKNDVKRGWVLSLLGVDISKCDVEFGYDKGKQQLYKRAVLDSDYEIDINNYIIKLNAGEHIYRWIHETISIEKIKEELKNVGMEIVTFDSIGSTCICVCKVVR